VHVSAQPQVPGATPVAATTHVVHQNPHPLSNRTAIEAGAGTQMRHVPTKAGTPQTMLR
jgi:hypothetical protein